MSFTDKEIERFVKDQKEYMLSKPSEAHAIVGYDEWFVEWLKQHDQRLIEEIEREVKDMTIKLGSFDEKDIANINQRSIGAIKFKDQVLQKLAEYKV